MSGVMKVLLVAFFVSCVLAEAPQDFCYKEVAQACDRNKNLVSMKNCSAVYGGIGEVQTKLQEYANTHISRSFEYLLLSTHYANYQKNRPGFEKLFRDFSDDKWHEAIEIIKYITKRGGVMSFFHRKPDAVNPEKTYELYELQSVAKALDMEKSLANDAQDIHYEASSRETNKHDAEISSYIEEEFSHKHASNIRKLAGYAADLTKLLGTNDRSLSLYLFDQYLQKSA